MKNFLKNITISFIVGIMLTLICIFGFILLMSSGVNGALLGGYLIIALFPALIIIIIDRICVWKFGAKKVNIVSIYILAGLFALAILRSIIFNTFG